jgi:hypothetical protein
VAAQIQDERSLPEQPQRDSAGASPIAHYRNVSRLPERDSLVRSIRHAVAVSVKNPGTIAKDAYSLGSGPVPFPNDGKVGRVPVRGRRNVRRHMPLIGGEGQLT